MKMRLENALFLYSFNTKLNSIIKTIDLSHNLLLFYHGLNEKGIKNGPETLINQLAFTQNMAS